VADSSFVAGVVTVAVEVVPVLGTHPVMLARVRRATILDAARADSHQVVLDVELHSGREPGEIDGRVRDGDVPHAATETGMESGATWWRDGECC